MGLFASIDAPAGSLYNGVAASDVLSHSFGASSVSRAVGAAPDGSIYVGFFSADSTQLRVARSSDRGATFSPSVLVDTAAAGTTFSAASVDVSSTGNVVVAYADSLSNVFAAHSSNGGATFTVVSGLGAAPSTSAGIQVQTQGNYVYVGYIIGGGVAVVASSDSGATFATPVPVTNSGGYFGLLVDRSNGDVIVGGENADLYVRVSHDHGVTFDSAQNPSGKAYFSNWTISSDVSGRYLWVGGSDIGLPGGGVVNQIDLSNWASIGRSAFLPTATPQARSMYAGSCGDVVDSVGGSLAVSHGFGTSLGTTHAVSGANQTTSINPFTNDVLVTYQNGSTIRLDVYDNELIGCTPHLSLAVSDGHDFARYGQTMNYLVTLSSDGFQTADNVDVSLGTPGSGLDLANSTWTCVGSDNTAICPASSGTGSALGSVTLPSGTSMTWVVSVPVLVSTTDDTIELDVSATGATMASDVDVLVIFRDSFDVTNGDGTNAPQ